MAAANQDNLSDQELLKRTAIGDQSAFNQLYDRHSKQIYNYVLRLINEITPSEDIIQETFFVVWQNAGRFRGQAKVKTWLFRIAHNRAVSWLRRHHKQIRDLEQILEDKNIQSPDSQSPENLTMQQWQQDQLIGAIRQLSPKHRAVVELTFVHNFSYNEIGDILGCPVGTVKSRMSYAILHLRRELTRRDADDV